jgi:hypothetical protein
MAQATAVQTKIAMIAAIRFSMVVCASSLSAEPQPTSPSWHCQVLVIVKYKHTRGSALVQNDCPAINPQPGLLFNDAGGADLSVQFSQELLPTLYWTITKIVF